VNFSSKLPSDRNLFSLFVHVLNFSKMYAASPAGEAAMAAPLRIISLLIFKPVSRIVYYFVHKISFHLKIKLSRYHVDITYIRKIIRRARD